MMKKLSPILFIVIVVSLVLAGCGGQGSGPRVWIDWPLEENNPVPLQPLFIQAHASDAEGVVSMEFAVDGRKVNSSDLNGDRLDYAIFEWTPPGPGTYIVSVQGTDSGGDAGAPTRVTIVVSGEEAVAAVENPSQPSEEKPVQDPESEEQPPPAGPEPPSPPEEPASPEGVLTKNSNCRSGADVVFDIVAILLQGQTVPIVGKSQDQYYLVVTEPERGQNCWLAASLVDIHGDLGQVSIMQPPPLPVAEEPPVVEPPPPPPDTLAPIIVSITLAPNKITVSGSGCSGKPRTSTSALTVFEEGGISSVSAAWTLGSASGIVNYSTSDGSSFTGIFGPVDTNGTMYINGSVVDNAGNWTPFVHTLTVEACID
jgi:hypothetical protein